MSTSQDLLQRQGQYLIEFGFATREMVSAAYRECLAQPGLDLCHWFMQRGAINEAQARHVRQAALMSTPSSGRLPVYDPAVSDDPNAETINDTVPKGGMQGAPKPTGPKPKQGDLIQVAGYKIVRKLGGGGMGDVYVATSPKHHEEVALKVMRGHAVTNPDMVQRFLREAETMSQLSHPNLVSVEDYGEDNGLYYLVMELIDGVPLNDKLRTEGPLDPVEAARLLRQIAEGLDFAHKRGVLHRDIKPPNILIRSEDGRAFLTDFGVAKHFLDDRTQLTRSGQLVGTPRYMAPEQADGDNQYLDQRTDVYALGVTLYEMLVGMPPFRAAAIPQLLHQILSKDPVPLRTQRPEVPRDLETICLKCLEKEPSLRYFTALELSEDLLRFVNDETILARPLSRSERFQRWCRRNKRALQGLAAGFVMALGTLFYVSVWPVLKSLLKSQNRQLRQEILVGESQRWTAEVSRNLTQIRERYANIDPGAAGVEAEALAKNLRDSLTNALLGIRNPGEQQRRFQSVLKKKGYKEDISLDLLSFARLQLSLTKLDSEEAYTRAVVQDVLGHRARAEALRGQAYESDPSGPFGLLSKLELAESLMERELYKDAAAVFRTLLGFQDAEVTARAQYNLCQCLLEQGFINDAVSVALDLKTDDLPRRVRSHGQWMRVVLQHLQGSAGISKRPAVRLTPLTHERRSVFYEALNEKQRTRLHFFTFDSAAKSNLKPLTDWELSAALGRNHFTKLGDAWIFGCELMPTDSSPRSLCFYEFQYGLFKNRQTVAIPADMSDFVFAQFGDFDGNGKFDSLWIKGRDLFICFDSNFDLGLKPLKGPSGSEGHVFGIVDYNEDGLSDLLYHAAEWSHFIIFAFEGQRGIQELRHAYDKRIGVLRSFETDLRGGDHFEMLLSTRRPTRYDIGVIFGSDFSPHIPPGLWRLTFEHGQFHTEKVLVHSLEERDGRAYGQPHFLNEVFKDQAASFSVNFNRFQTEHSKARTLIYRKPGTRPVSILTAHSHYDWRDVDGDGDAELLVLRSGDIAIYGLKGVNQAVGKPSPTAHEVDLGRQGLASAWMRAGDFKAARGVLEELLADASQTVAQRGFVRLQLVQCLAALGELKAAREQCLKVADSCPPLARSALLQAAEFAEAQDEWSLALKDLQRVQALPVSSAREQWLLLRRLWRLSELQAMTPQIQWTGPVIKGAKHFGVLNPHCFARQDSDDGTNKRRVLTLRSTGMMRGELLLPMIYKGGPVRLRARVGIDFLEHGSGIELALTRMKRWPKGEPGPKVFGEDKISLRIFQDGGGDHCSHRTYVKACTNGSHELGVLGAGAEIDVDMIYLPNLSELRLRWTVLGRSHFQNFVVPSENIRGDCVFEIRTFVLDRAVRGQSSQCRVRLEDLELSGLPKSLMPNTDIMLPYYALSGRDWLEGRLELAIDRYQREASGAPPHIQAETMFLAGLAEIQRGRRAQGVELMKRALKINQGAVEHFSRASLFLFSEAECRALLEALNVNKPDMLSFIQQQAASNAPDVGLLALFSLAMSDQEMPPAFKGFAWVNVGNFKLAEKAMENYRGSLEPTLRFQLGMTYYRQGQFEQAMDVWNLEVANMPRPMALELKRTKIHCEFMLRKWQPVAKKKP